MAQTNVQAFSGDVAISSNLAVDTNTLFVDSVGNKVGIGTASPGAPLHIYKREDTFGSLVELLRLERYTNDFDNRIDAAGGYIGFHANDGNSAIGEVARISFRQKGESSTANAEDDGGMGFWTKLDDSLAERVTITPNGNVGIGTTNPGSYKLDVNGTVHLPSIHRTNFTKELSEYFELESGAATEVTLNSLLVEINVSGTSYTDQSEYAGTIDLDIIAQRTNSAYGLDIVKTQLHFTAGWNEQYDAWERLRFNQEIKAQDIESYRSITTVPVFRYTYTSRKLQIYIQYNALQYRVKHSFTARVTSDEPFAGDIISYPGGAPMSGTDAAAFQCLSYGTSGNVGIGTNSPTSNLHVVGDVAISSNLAVDTNTLFVDSVGNKVGIGTANPETKLHVKGGSICVHRTFPDTPDAGIVFMEDHYNKDCMFIAYDAGGVAETDDESLRFYSKSAGGADPTITGANLLMCMRADGNVGIGTTNPQAPFHVKPVNNSVDTENTLLDFRGDFTVHGYLGIFATETHTNAVGPDLRFKGAVYNATPSPTINQVMCLKPSGKVGIGTTSPGVPLHVNGGNNPTISTGDRTYFRYDNAVLTDIASVWTATTSIYATHAIVCGSYLSSVAGTIGASDERIKKEIVDVEDGAALETLRLLKPKQYKYKDEVQRGTEPVWGFIAQEVGATLPYATQTRTECLPNIYELVNVSDSNVITFTNFDTSNLESNAMVLKVYDVDDKEHLVNIAEVIDGHSVRVDEDLMEWTGSVDESGNVVAGNQLFVYGQQVDDFVFLQKDAIWTVATSALQEVDRQLQAEKVKVAALETQLSSVLTRLDALESA